MVLRATLVGQLGEIVLPGMTRDEIDDLRRDHHAARKRRRRREAILHCVECHRPLHPVRYLSGLDTFAHDPGHGHHCSLARRESERHEGLKTVICRAAGTVKGFKASVEVRGDGIDPDTGHPPVIDVAAWPVDGGRKSGWEVQLSPATDAAVLNRHEVRMAFLERCCWLSETTPAWSEQVPWLGVTREARTNIVTRGLVFWDGLDYTPSPPEPLVAVVKDQIRRHLIHADALGGWYRPGLNGPVRSRPGGTKRAGTRTGQGHRPVDHCDRPPLAPPAVDRAELHDAALWRLRPNLPSLRQFSETDDRPLGVGVDRRRWPAELRAEVEQAEARMAAARRPYESKDGGFHAQ